jgi:hypothetical protein
MGKYHLSLSSSIFDDFSAAPLFITFSMNTKKCFNFSGFLRKLDSLFDPCHSKLSVREQPVEHSIGNSLFVKTQWDEEVGTSYEDRKFMTIMDSELANGAPCGPVIWFST